MRTTFGEWPSCLERFPCSSQDTALAFRQFVAPLSKGLPGAPKTVDYGLGILVGRGWLVQNPVFNGYTGMLAYLPSQRIAMLIEVTHGPNATATSIATDVFKVLTPYLTPDNPITT